MAGQWEGRAGQGTPGQGRAHQGRAGHTRAAHQEGRPGQSYGRVEHGRALGGPGRVGQGRAGQGRAGQGRAGLGRQGKLTCLNGLQTLNGCAYLQGHVCWHVWYIHKGICGCLIDIHNHEQLNAPLQSGLASGGVLNCTHRSCHLSASPTS